MPLLKYIQSKLGFAPSEHFLPCILCPEYAELAMFPCCHICVCHNCFNNILSQSPKNSENVLCPKCNNSVTNFLE